MSSHEMIHPPGWDPPKGYSNGVLAAPGGRLLFVAGQVAWSAEQTIVGEDFPGQFRQALSNVVDVVRTAGGAPEHLTRLTIYVTDRNAYLDNLRDVGAAYREIMGRHFPAMALVQVAALIETGAQIEIEGTAVLP
ncbi:MAG: RidA family protein [Planctomycetota bacterium]|nr:RidA family protein [Planctomycetota bacterium]